MSQLPSAVVEAELRIMPLLAPAVLQVLVVISVPLAAKGPISTFNTVVVLVVLEQVARLIFTAAQEPDT